MHARRVGRGVGLLLLVALAAAGCDRAKEFSPEDFKKVEPGMTEGQVEEVLGRPKESMEVMGVKRSFWQVGDKYYSVSFKEGKVSAPLGPTDRQEYERMRALGEMMRGMEKK